ncbi:hypothetical protein EW146_g6273 [Bondarzewia mesenterica]|uniref:Sister chromatid cohesion protein n=1 Tax=Bondarzewia mesenterica TaxID=1095465 RepID=A0A4S4LP30_9AGAM|nr:hypothetical protein EW146_g6273 [Bondarzewia mesenterica]
MDSNGWYSSSKSNHNYTYSSPDAPGGGPDPLQDSRRLLAMYPLASATPTAHVARQLRNLTVSAAPPSYVQPHYYNVNNATYPTATYPSATYPSATYPSPNAHPYSEYASEINHLHSQQQPANDSGYWENTRDHAVRYLGQNGNTPYVNYQPQTQYLSSPSYPTYQTNAFAQSVFQHTIPSISYPTPPPPGIQSSSSSLAYALGEPPARPQPKIFHPQESASFFNNFLDKSSRELEKAQAAKYTNPSTPSRRDKIGLHSSPDPLAISPSSVPSPQKRKSVEQVQSPSIKRAQLVHRTASSSSLSAAPSTPTSSQTRQSSSSSQVTPKPKKRLLAYVELPPISRTWNTPSSSHSQKDRGFKTPVAKGKSRMNFDSPDLGGFGSPEDDYKPRKTSLAMGDVAKSSAKRTGERDDRGPLEKLTALLEDIFEAEDSLPADADLESLPAGFFSQLTVEPARPQLHPNMIRKLTKCIGKVARPMKRLRGHTGPMKTPRSKGPGSIADLDTTMLSRILKMLERSVRVGEDLDPFKNSQPQAPRGVSMSPTKKKAAKAKKAASQADRRSNSHTPAGDGEEAMEAHPIVYEVTEADLEKLARTLDIARDSILAADCCIALLGSDRLPKQVYSEELITTCLMAIKNQLNKISYPFVEASSDAQASGILQHLTKASSHDLHNHRRQLAETFQALSSVLPRINNLVCADTVVMSDSLIIQAVYIAIGPFFVVESNESEGKGKKENVIINTLGQSAMRGLRLDALSLIRSIFANHEDQRSWIIEEILGSLIRLSDTKQKAGQFRLRDGRSIRTVSALLLQLVQTSAHGVRIEARRLSKARQQTLALRRQESLNEKTEEPFIDERDAEEIQLYMSGLESATKAAKTIVLFLTQRSGKGKTTKNSNEAEYRTIFDNLVSDLLVVLFWPEWPAASLLLSIVCRFMVSSLDDVKTTNQNDNNAAKTIALDHLGVIAARLRSSTLKFKQVDNGSDLNAPAPLRPLDEALSSANIKQLERLVAAHQDVVTHLSKRSSEDQAYESARELTAVNWGQELAIVLKQCNAALSNGDDDGDDLDLIKADQPKMIQFGKKVKAALRDVWKDAATDVFDIGTQDEVAHVDRLAEEIGIIQDLKNSYNPILSVILLALDAPPVFMRTKALRALGQIVTSDPTILAAGNVRRGIESHLLDSSPAVRDAAVELIGKYMVDSPEVAGDYYQKIADRIADTGLGVRKRVIKLLKSFYGVIDDSKRRIDICTRLVLRMFDEDDTVKELAVKTVEELWFQNSTPAPASQRSRSAAAPGTSTDKTQLLAKVSIIMGVSGNFKDRQSPLEDLLHKIMADKEGAEASVLHERYGEICEVLIDGLVDASELPGFTVINCIRTIYLFTMAYPTVLSGSNATTLLPYLKNSSTPEEQITSDYLLKIFRASVPNMPKTAVKFGQELQLALQPMILRPPTAGGVLALQETVACMCAVIENLTHDFVRLVALLKSCNLRLQQAIARPVTQTMAPAEARALSILTFIVSLLAEHCDFDRLRNENEEFAAELNAVSKGSIILHIYHSLLKLYQKHAESALRGRILQCLGFLFRAQPTLMTLDSSAMIMDAIFASSEDENRGRLLKIMQDFLLSEATKHTEKEKKSAKGNLTLSDVNMEELVGNTDGFADSGVSSAIVQRYLDPILQAALSQHAQTQAAAVDILSFTIKQGLAHPLQSFPVIVALETSPNNALSGRASALHTILHSKHASLLNSRYTISARSSFDYQKKLASGPVQGYCMKSTPTALLQRWYSLVREKRASKLDFLKSLVRVFDMNTSLSSTQDDIDFIRYMAENFATFDYKSQEEVLMVVKSLIAVLSTTGMQLMETLSPSHLLAQLRSPMHMHTNSEDVQMIDVQLNADSQGSNHLLNRAPVPEPAPWQSLDKLPILRCSVVIAMIMLLKGYLKILYGLTEDKCLKWVTGKKNAMGDKPANRRHNYALTWERLPFATAPVLTTQDMATQRDTFLEIWNEDGVAAEPEDDLA